jgi:hypothetical protein
MQMPVPEPNRIAAVFIRAAEDTATRHGFAFDAEVGQGLNAMATMAASIIHGNSVTKGDLAERYATVNIAIGRQGIIFFVDEMAIQQSRAILRGEAQLSGATVAPPDFTASHPWRISASIFKSVRELFCPFLFCC